MNAEVGETWRCELIDGHYGDVHLEEVGKPSNPPLMVNGFPAVPATVAIRHVVDCPACSGLTGLARAVQVARARQKLAKQRL